MHHEQFPPTVPRGDRALGRSALAELSIGRLAGITGGALALGAMPPRGRELEPVGRVITDSREVADGDLFWGLPGSQQDGSLYVEDAFLRAAAGAVVAGRVVEPWAGKYCIHVADSRAALCRLARWARDQFSGTVVAVLGGSQEDVLATTSLIHRIIRSTERCSADVAPLSCPVGAALATFAWCADHEYTLVPISARATANIREISHLCSPHITSITGHHKTRPRTMSSREAIAAVQQRLLTALPRGGLTMLNGNDPFLRRAARKAAVPALWVGAQPDCDIVVQHARNPDGTWVVLIDNQRVILPSQRQHNVTLLTMALAVAKIIGVPWSDAIAALETSDLVSQHVARHHGGRRG